MRASPSPLLRKTSISLKSPNCLLCQWRSFNASYRRPADNPQNEALQKRAPPSIPSVLDEAPRAYGKAVEDFTPKPLNRPIGLPSPPRSGENTGIDHRTLQQKRDDFVDYDKHIIKRKRLIQKISTPYFREWTNMRHHKGKSFLAPPRLFKADHALYFPNLSGQTLLKDKIQRDTTPSLEGKVSVVSVFSSAWAERQAESFVGKKNNSELHQIVSESGGVAQMVQINVEDNALKAAIVRLFMPSLRKRLGPGNWGRYFLVRKGLTMQIKDAIGLLNSKVGYTYLLDGNVRIRWAASGISEGDEKNGLVRGVRRLIDEAKPRHGDRTYPKPENQIVDSR